MLAMIRKIFLASVVLLIVLTTGAWQSDPVALALNQTTSIPETPLYPGFTWSSLGFSTQNVRINVNGDSISLSGEGFQTLEQYIPGIHQDVLEYYSNEQLAKSGWVSYDSFEGPDGMQFVFYHESGVFLSVGFLKCLDVPSNTCVTIWRSEQTEPAIASPNKTPETNGVAALSTFGKRNPSNGQTNLNPANTTLSWEAYSPTPDKYAYCIKAGSACPNNDPNWTSTYNRSITLTNLSYNTIYYWQVRAVTCETCTPKTFVYANGGTVWTFQTRPPTSVTILGNAGVPGALLSYIDGIAKTVTADATGAYSISVPFHWSGTITPSKAGYLFTPTSASFSNLMAPQTIQNFTALVAYVISGNVTIGDVTLTYMDGTLQFVMSDGSGNYSITVPAGWNGMVTPHRIGYAFTPVNKPYSNVQSNQTNQNYTAEVCATCADADTVGVFRPSNGALYLKNLNLIGYADVAINYGLPNDYPVVGDWDGDGDDTIGVYRNGVFYLRNSNTIGYADVYFNFGSPGDQPIAGDWNGDGVDTIGVYRSSNFTFYLRNSNTTGAPDAVFQLGMPGDVGIAGDWNGDGSDTTGVFRPSSGVIFLKNANTTGVADIGINYGIPGDKPITGDWDDDGIDTIGVYRGNTFYLRNSNTVGYADEVFALGIPGDMPIAGNWDALP